MTTLVQEAKEIMEKMPIENQQAVKSKFNLPADFDEHFDDLNDEISALFCGESV